MKNKKNFNEILLDVKTSDNSMSKGQICQIVSIKTKQKSTPTKRAKLNKLENKKSPKFGDFFMYLF